MSRPRFAAVVALAMLLAVYTAAAGQLWDAGLNWDLAFLTVVLIPAFLLVPWLALPVAFRRGLLLVALALLATLTALAAPTFMIRRTDDERGLSRVLQRSRELAIRRAESLSLYIDATRRWSLGSDGSPPQEHIQRDSLKEGMGSAAHIRISPLGSCYLESGRLSTAATLVQLDGVRCAVIPVAAGAAATLLPAGR